MTNNTPKVSIIIAVKNALPTLARCLDSINFQNYPNRELIILDAVSNDGSIAVLEEYDASIDYWTSEPDSGIYNAWNKGLRISTGDWVCFIGADDFYASPDSLTQMMSIPMQDPSVDYVTSRCAKVNREGEILNEFGLPRVWKQQIHRVRICHPGSLYRKSLFDMLGAFSEELQISADYEFDLRMGPTVNAAHVDKVLLNLEDSGVSRSQLLRTQLEALKVRKKYIGSTHASFNFIQQYTEAKIFNTLRWFGIHLIVRKFLVRIGVISR